MLLVSYKNTEIGKKIVSASSETSVFWKKDCAVLNGKASVRERPAFLPAAPFLQAWN